jgi:predicted DNA-binding ribbon-helix-helix protein
MDSPATAVRKRSVVLAGHRTSISLEAEFWQALREVAAARLLSVNALVAAVDAARGPARPANLSSALRVFILDCYRSGELPFRPPRGRPGTPAS